MFGYAIVTGLVKIVSGITKLVWLLVMLLGRVVSEMVSSVH